VEAAARRVLYKPATGTEQSERGEGRRVPDDANTVTGTRTKRRTSWASGRREGFCGTGTASAMLCEEAKWRGQGSGALFGVSTRSEMILLELAAS
jgi:hypothetical protein